MTTPSPKPSTTASIILTVILGFVLAGGVSHLVFKRMLGKEEPSLEIVASARQTSDSRWTITGQVLFQGEPVHQPTVWAVISDSVGKRLSAGAISNDAPGTFRIEGIDLPSAGTNRASLLQAEVHAKADVRLKESGSQSELTPISGQAALVLGEFGGTRLIKLPHWAVALLVWLFVCSILLALIGVEPDSWAIAVKYYFSIIWALLFTVAMVISIAVGLAKVNGIAAKGDMVSLGFATVFHGTYVKDVEPDWLLSLTAPASPSTAFLSAGTETARGLGAPLWVMLLSVIGSGIFTLLVVINGISPPPDFSQGVKVSDQIEEILKHQFYILFSPIGAIIFYQMLVVAGAASQPVTVALAALAAGVSLNLLLGKAVSTLENILRGDAGSKVLASVGGAQVVEKPDGTTDIRGGTAEEQAQASEWRNKYRPQPSP